MAASGLFSDIAATHRIHLLKQHSVSLFPEAPEGKCEQDMVLVIESCFMDLSENLKSTNV